MTQSAFEGCLLSRINADRAAVGAGPLDMAWDRVLFVRAWSEWMSQNTFRHMTNSEREPGLPSGTSTWSENIARHWMTSSDCSDVHDMLMDSPGHRDNIVDPDYKFVALGAHIDSSGWWVTQLFFDAAGYPPPTADLCPSGADCDTTAVQDWGGRFEIWSEATSGEPVASFYFGNPGDVAFSGDWNCDGVDTIGLYRRSDGYVYLRNSNTDGAADTTFFFGNPGDLPVAGDFDGDGCDTVSIYRPSLQRFYIINRLGEDGGGLGAADYSFMFGNPGDKPFVGDFNADGVDTIGLHRESTGLVYFRNSNSSGVADFEFIFGNPGDKVLAGDWDGDGDDTVGAYRPGNGLVYLRNSNTQGTADAWAFAGSYAGYVALDS